MDTAKSFEQLKDFNKQVVEFGFKSFSDFSKKSTKATEALFDGFYKIPESGQKQFNELAAESEKNFETFKKNSYALLDADYTSEDAAEKAYKTFETGVRDYIKVAEKAQKKQAEYVKEVTKTAGAEKIKVFEPINNMVEAGFNNWKSGMEMVLGFGAKSAKTAAKAK